MSGTGYRILGFVVWQGGKWYVRRNYGRYLPSGRTAGATAGLLALVVGALVFLAARRED